MRLHTLELAAFGPYPNQHTVDFDELGADGVFLLYGDTGAGKTTVLDAVAFALYGKVPGAREGTKRLRCDTAPETVATVVALELTVQGHRFRLRRSPEYERPKKHRDGYTKQPAKASLTWLDDGPDDAPSEGLTRIDEVNRTVERLLGMTDRQFFQVVLLPQGEFARFLRSDIDEREKLLETLFGTRHFADVEKWFAERRRQSRRSTEEKSQRAREQLARVTQAAGTEPGTEDDERSWLESLEKLLATELEDATAELSRLRRTRDSAERVLTERRELAEKVRRVHQANVDLAEIDEYHERHAAWRSEKEAAERAVPVAAVEQSRRGALTERDRALAEVDDARAACPEIEPETPTERLREWASACQERAGGLAQLLPEVRQQEADHQRLGELADRITEDERTQRELADQQADLPARIAEAREQLDAANQAEATVDGVRSRVSELTELVRLARELPGARDEVETARTRASEAVDEHQRARERTQELRARRLAGMAAELAGSLCAGEPCQVCGSRTHPDPAGAVDDPVRSDDEQRAQQEEHNAHARREQATARSQAAEQAIERLRERLGEHTEPELAAELAENSERLDTLRARVEALPQRRAHLEELENRAERITTEHGQVSTRIAANRSEHTALQSTVDARTERLREARGESAGIAERRAELLDQATRMDRLITARTAHEDAERRADARYAELRQAAVDNGFPDIDVALAAQRDEQRIKELVDSLAEVEQRAAVARAVLTELPGIDPTTRVDLDWASANVTAAHQEVERAAARVRGAEQREQEVSRLAEGLRTQWKELAPARAEFAELDALTDVVTGQGQNARKMSLHAYVLAARLEEVAVAATRRLQRMSENRYSFVHSDAAGPRGTRGGLGLDVLDDYSGKVRPAKTLSGGESFLASLSLALGLADVVAAETGGALLDTLFIDEGFGSLDPTALDLVMDTLDELRSGGRVIGLVSHVEELRQRIGVRLRVRKARTGSTLELET